MSNLEPMEAEIPLTLVSSTPHQDERLFGLFLQDHLAALEGACALVRRALKENRHTPVGRVLAPLHIALREDLLHLQDVAKAHGLRPSRTRKAAARAAELAGRLKLNGRIFSYSPLSRVMELEGLMLICVQRAAVWRILEARALLDLRLRTVPVDFADRADLAARQAELLERTLVREGGLTL